MSSASRIYKWQGPRDSGSPHVSGWAVRLFPYLVSPEAKYAFGRDGGAVPPLRRNPWLSGPPGRHGPGRDDFPCLPSRAPFRWLDQNPIFRPAAKNGWEKDRVTACQVVRHKGWHLMFYIGFKDQHHAAIGLARSRDGITGWERHPANPVIRPGGGRWDGDAVYKPYALFDGRRWLLWYNGRKGDREQIGLATHEGDDLGF
jgi:hypothetical protein